MFSPSARNKFSILGSLVVAIILLFAINLVSSESLSRFRLDLTEDRLYTLSDRTATLLQTLDESITLSFFITKSELLQIPGIGSYAGRVEDMLREFERMSDGKISLNIVDPRPFSETEDVAVGHGLLGIPLKTGSKFYFGLVASNSTDGVQVVPHFFLEREELLEYDLVRLIVQLDGRPRKKIGLISSLPIQGTGGAAIGPIAEQGPWTFYLQMNEFFQVEVLSPQIESLPDEIETLFLLHPRNISENLLYEIDQFVLSGNTLLLALDPHSEYLAAILEASPQLPDIDVSSDLNELTSQWGIVLREGQIVGDLPIAARVVDSNDSSGRSVDYPVWMNLQPEQLNQQDVVTAKLGNVVFATTGVFDIQSDATTEITPLIRTAASAKLYEVDEFTKISSIQELLADYQERGEQMPIAARVRGTASSAFPDGSPNPNAIVEEHRMTGDINVIMIADTDFLHDRFWVRKQPSLGQVLMFSEASNGELINNAVDNLSGDNSLIGVRTRGRSARPFVLTQTIRKAAEQKYLQHERELREELQRIEAFLTDFSANRADSSGERIITDEQRSEIKRIRESQLSIRQQLREVQHNLVKDIQQLENRVTLVNLLLVPLMLAIAGTIICTIGVRHRERRLALDISSHLR